MKLAQILIACTIIEAIQAVRPGAEWTITGFGYSNLVWIDKSQTKPTPAELVQAVSDCNTQEATKATQKAQAILDAKNTLNTPQVRLDALIKAIDLK